MPTTENGPRNYDLEGAKRKKPARRATDLLVDTAERAGKDKDMNADDLLKSNQYRHPHNGQYTTGTLGVPQIQGGPAPAKTDASRQAGRNAADLLDHQTGVPDELVPEAHDGDEDGRGGGTAA